MATEGWGPTARQRELLAACEQVCDSKVLGWTE